MTIATPSFKHYFFDIAPGNTVAFFEYVGEPIDSFAKPAGVPYPQASQFDHLSLALADEEALLRLRDRLKEHDCEVTDVVDHGIDAVDLLHRPQRHRPRGVVVGHRPDRPAGRLRRRAVLRRPRPGATRSRSCAAPASWPGRLAPSS